jgi:hypothetical protein
MAGHLVALLTEPGSAYHADPALGDDCRRMLDFVLRRQFRDGSLDLGLWHHAPCEAGFCVGAVAAGCHDLRAMATDFAGRSELAGQLAAFLDRAVPITRTGPMYTANHRWSAAVGPLAWVDRFFPDPANRAAIDRHLATGLDIDAEGLYYYELSMGGYNTVANRGLLSAGILLDRPDLVDTVRRNLHSSILFINPDGDIDTSFSFRQDRGRPGVTGLDWLCARLVSLATGDGVLASLADRLFAEIAARPTHTADNFSNLYWMRHVPALHGEDSVPRQPVPTHGRRHFRTACVYRVRDGEFAASVKGNPPIREPYNDPSDGWCGRSGAANLLSVWHGPAVLDAVMIKACYQNYQAMKPRGLDVAGNRCIMDYQFAGFPLLEAPFLASREERGFQWADLRMHAEVTVDSGRIDLDVRVDVPDGIETQVTVEFLLRPDGRLVLAGTPQPLAARQVVWFAADSAEYTVGSHGLRIAGGLQEHHWFLEDFKIESGWAETHCARLVAAGHTPFRHTFTVTPFRTPYPA